MLDETIRLMQSYQAGRKMTKRMDIDLRRSNSFFQSSDPTTKSCNLNVGKSGLGRFRALLSKSWVMGNGYPEWARDKLFFSIFFHFLVSRDVREGHPITALTHNQSWRGEKDFLTSYSWTPFSVATVVWPIPWNSFETRTLRSDSDMAPDRACKFDLRDYIAGFSFLEISIGSHHGVMAALLQWKIVRLHKLNILFNLRLKNFQDRDVLLAYEGSNSSQNWAQFELPPEKKRKGPVRTVVSRALISRIDGNTSINEH